MLNKDHTERRKRNRYVCVTDGQKAHDVVTKLNWRAAVIFQKRSPKPSLLEPEIKLKIYTTVGVRTRGLLKKCPTVQK